MLGRLIRWAREGTIATFTVLAVASAPVAAEAGWWDDVKDAGRALGGLFDPRHDIGKFSLGSVMVGGGLAVIAGAEMATAVGAAAIVGTAITGGGILLVAAGVGLAVWGGYKLWKSFNGDDEGDRTRPRPPDRPTGPGTGGDPGRPGRIDPDRPGSGTTTTGPGTIGSGGSSTPGDNGPRVRPEAPGPLRSPTGVGNGATSGRAGGAGMSGGILPR